MNCICRPFGIACLLGASALNYTARAETSRQGVVFFCPKEIPKITVELDKIKADGFRLIEFAAWPWDLPLPGSDLETRARTTLDWCDKNETEFFLIQNIQYGDAGMGAGLDDAFGDRAKAKSLCVDWARVLQGHPSVKGVILGNEVGALQGNSKEHPVWWKGFVAFLAERYEAIENLNRRWGTSYAQFGDIKEHIRSDGAAIDIEDYAERVFNAFYAELFRTVFQPVIPLGLFGSKINAMLDPSIFHNCTDFTMVCWDDVVSMYPLWRMKITGDIGRQLKKPVFNSELHLYLDGWDASTGPAAARYRYYLSLLNAERRTASYAWGMWNKPEVAKTHQETVTIIKDTRALEPYLDQLANADPEWHVLVSRSLTRGHDVFREGKRPLAQLLYARFASQPEPWRFVVSQDVGAIGNGKVFLSEGIELSLKEWQQLADLPAEVMVVSASKDVPTVTSDGRIIPDPLRNQLKARSRPGAAFAFLSPDLKFDRTDYPWWAPDEGTFSYPVLIPRVEIRTAPTPEGMLVCLINHQRDETKAPVDYVFPDGDTKREEIKPTGSGVFTDAKVRLQSLEVRLFMERR